jgi:hypothetical protein
MTPSPQSLTPPFHLRYKDVDSTPLLVTSKARADHRPCRFANRQESSPPKTVLPISSLYAFCPAPLSHNSQNIEKQPLNQPFFSPPEWLHSTPPPKNALYVVLRGTSLSFPLHQTSLSLLVRVMRPLPRVLLNRDPLHEVAHDLLLTTVIEAGRAGVGVTGQVLHVFKRRAVLQQVRDDGHAEGVRRQVSGQ